MAIAFVSAGAGAVGSTSLAVPHPATVTAGNLLVLHVVNKYPNNSPTTPTGWTRQKQTGGGAGAAAADTGNVYASIYTKVADGSETGNLTVTITSGNSAMGRMRQYSIEPTSTWLFQAVGGAYDAAAGAAWSVTGDAVLDIVRSDFVIALSAVNTDLYTFSAQVLAATGVSFGTMNERDDSVTGNGDDCAIVVTEHPVLDGKATAAPVYTMTASGTAASNPAGATVCLRLRELLYESGGGGGGSPGGGAGAAAPSVEHVYAVPQIKLKDYGLRKGRAKTHESPYNR